MKKIVSIMLCVILLAAMASFATVNAADAYKILVVSEGKCELIDNPDTNDQASGNALCFAEAYGTGRTTQGDVVKFKDVDFGEGVTNIAVKCGYNLGESKKGTGTEFWVYIDDEKCEGEPIAKFAVNDSETKSSQIVDQLYKNADVTEIKGIHNVFVKGETEYSGSFSQVVLTYKGGKFDEAAVKAQREAEVAKEVKLLEIAAKVEAGETDYIICSVVNGKCELIDNPDTNDQAAGNALCFAEAYGTGRTTQGDVVKFKDVDFGEGGVTNVAVKCGYNLGESKKGTATQFWVFIDDEKCEGEPIAKFEVSDSETKSSQIVDQVYKNADIKKLTGKHNVFVKGETEYSGSFSQVVFTKDGNTFDETFVKAQKDAEDALVIKQLEEEAKKAAEEEAKKKAEEEAKKAEEEAKADEEAKTEEEAPAEETAPTDAEAPAEAANNAWIWWVIAIVVIVAIVVIAVVMSKKKKK